MSKKILINGGISVAMAVASVVAIAVSVRNPQARARTVEQIDAEINQLEIQIQNAQKQAGDLRAKSEELQNELNSVTAQRAVLESQIRATRAQYQELQAEIKQTEENIVKNRKALGVLLAKMSVEDELSPIERLAGSQNISTALDNFEYQSSVKNRLVEKVGQIKEQKKSLEEKRDQVKIVMDNQQKFQAELQSKIDEQNRLIQVVRNEESEYNKYAESRTAQKSKLQQEQQRAFEEAQRKARASTGGGFSISSGSNSGGGYPWGDGCWVGDDLYSHSANGGVDPLGYGCRQCVSYTAYKAMAVHGVKPMWWGNANMWPASARARGFRTGRTPKANSVGVQYIGYYGHVVWIDSINADGTLNISQYNYPVDGKWGQYSTMRISPSAIHEYVYFD